jgi:hypothetical protein
MAINNAKREASSNPRLSFSSACGYLCYFVHFFLLSGGQPFRAGGIHACEGPSHHISTGCQARLTDSVPRQFSNVVVFTPRRFGNVPRHCRARCVGHVFIFRFRDRTANDNGPPRYRRLPFLPRFLQSPRPLRRLSPCPFVPCAMKPYRR